jgi:hypothetical protein
MSAKLRVPRIHASRESICIPAERRYSRIQTAMREARKTGMTRKMVKDIREGREGHPGGGL